MAPFSKVLEGNSPNEESVFESGPDLAVRVLSSCPWTSSFGSAGMVPTRVVVLWGLYFPLPYPNVVIELLV